ncbi:nitroreductase family deazaflavin-dependent oxidoreductase [Amycolatopsis rhizosphaerae]|uniref:Nitroreductase family deazaflavin-dependent oxidoreductase n=1 Tax=Amycolatopsis rhizosphaerae TaxID=2053003 RepID=A0A558APR4_9PSEU|nr:nitroreductase family deazaflavin-dependent oxidoreductase [Amycolatopsis rhizosphaerae]TVT26255.1 nitroreductase family deazaflavin-dependent oxidoreductase [Amycolatopsis rhizosphaerae]
MVLSRKVARFNRVATNRVARLITGRMPGFGTIVHRGRRSGRVYRTPVNVFGTPTGYVVALTYGPDSDWVRNVLAAGGCGLETRGRTEELTAPRVVHDEARSAMPFMPRQVLGLARVTDFLYVDRVSPASRAAG